MGRILLVVAIVVIVVPALLSVLGSLMNSGGGGGGTTVGGDTPYANEDYQVPAADKNPPPLPQPKTLDEAQQMISANAIYSATVARPVRCELQPVRAGQSNAQQQALYEDFMACLMRVWGPTLQSQGFVAVRPTVTVYSSPVKSACGDTSMLNASYCGADQQVYVASNVLQVVPSNLRNSPFLIETILAHEFGHAIQARTGILVSEFVLEDRATGTPAKNLLSRRTETQADCFAGQFIGSVAQSLQLTQPDITNIGQLMFEIGDDQLTGRADVDGNHGHGASRKYWVEMGMASPQSTQCNTFTAQPNLVR